MFYFLILTDLTKVLLSFVWLKFSSFGLSYDGWRNKEKKSLSLGMPQHPKLLSKNEQPTKLGDAPEWHPLFLLTTIGILLEAIFLFVTYYEFCLERLVWYESLLVFLFIFSHLSLLDTPSWETKLCYDLLELLSMLHLNLFELWNCSSASLISFWAWCALIFLKKLSHASLRFI